MSTRTHERLRLPHSALLYAVLLAGAGAALGCGDTGTGPMTPTVASVVVSPASATLAVVGGTVQLAASARDAQGNPLSGKTFTWSSSSPGIATVSTSGLVTAVADGSVTITARVEGVAGTAAVTVAFTATTVTVSPPIATLGATGHTVQLTAVALDADSNVIPGRTFAWASSDERVATVSASGLVTAVGDGGATITAVADGASGSAAVWVFPYISLIAGSFTQWLDVLGYSGPTMLLSVASFEHSAPWGNAGMGYYGEIPRLQTANVAGGSDVGNIGFAWYRSYRALAMLRDGMHLFQDTTVVFNEEHLRAKAFGRFVQGLAHGTVAVLYDSGYVYDETSDPANLPFVGYGAMLDTALAYLNEAAALAASGSFTIPATWTSAAVSSDELGRLAHTAAARFRAGVARTPAERAAVDWAAVVVDVNAGITADWALVSDCNALNFCDDALTYRTLPGWNMMANWVLGMADQSGAYQTWMAAPLPDKMPFIMVTPDTRFPQGLDETTQLGNAGTYYEIASGADRIWSRPDRGTWRWSYYRYDALDDFATTGVGAIPLFTTAEMRFLLAEAAYRGGDGGTAASIVNETRTAHGLQGTDAGGTNTDCVPMLPDGSCGDLWEMLKWEKRLETHFRGALRIGWYFDGRGWGDLIEGTPLMLPVPYQEMVLRGQLPYDFGGVGGLWGAPIGTYGY